MHETPLSPLTSPTQHDCWPRHNRLWTLDEYICIYLLVTCACESVLDRMWGVSVLLTAERPLAVGIAWATGHSGTALASYSYSSPEVLVRPSSETQTTCSRREINNKKKFGFETKNLKMNIYVKYHFYARCGKSVYTPFMFESSHRHTKKCQQDLKNQLVTKWPQLKQLCTLFTRPIFTPTISSVELCLGDITFNQ